MRNTPKSRLPKTLPAKTLPESSFLDDVLQLAYPPEYRIKRPGKAQKKPEAGSPNVSPERPQETAPVATEASGAAADAGASPPRNSEIQPALAIEIANCLWYLKTQHFKQAWAADESVENDPRARRALGRINRGIKVLGDAEIKLIDPTGERYPPGGEGLMRPIQFEPTAGMTVDTVAKTIRPIILRGRSLIQRGEVLVAVPVEQSEPAAAPGDTSPPESSSGETANESAVQPVAEQEASDPPHPGAATAGDVTSPNRH